MATVRGTPVVFSYTTAAGATITGFTGWLMQSAKLKNDADEYKVKSGQGVTVTRIIEDSVKRMDLSFEISGVDRATAITNSALPALNTFAPITACAEIPEAVSAYWIVESVDKDTSNTGTIKVNMTLALYPSITV